LNADILAFPYQLKNEFSGQSSPRRKKLATIAYVISITECTEDRTLLDGAAVLKHSIHLASLNSKYDYKMYSFVHEDAKDCGSILSNIGYDVLIRPNPIKVEEIRNIYLRRILPNHACCGEKEFMKLYVYQLIEHPVAVHFDIDVLVLKPLDELFDLMLDEGTDRSQVKAMWDPPENFPSRIDFLFTRDYNMVDPPNNKIQEMGTQGGFLVVRPNTTDYNNLVEIVRDGANFSLRQGWGGRAARVGRFYGAASVQGLASYYYYFERGRALELNRCYYNNMVDDPMNTRPHLEKNSTLRCRTLEDHCQDCRKVSLHEIYTMHFTQCLKPWKCSDFSHKQNMGLCNDGLQRWHRVRRSLEEEWETTYYDNYSIESKTFFNNQNQTSNNFQSLTLGHCTAEGPEGYVKMKFHN
jgi:hypothetical protein